MTKKEQILDCLTKDELALMKAFIDANRNQVKRTINARRGLHIRNALFYGLSLEMIRLLLDEEVIDLERKGYSDFNWLASCSNIETAKLFIEAGVDVHYQTPKGESVAYYLYGYGGSRLELLHFYNELLQNCVVPESAEPNEAEFWYIIQQASRRCYDAEHRIASNAVQLLQDTTVTEIIRFELTLQLLLNRCTTAEIWATIYKLNGGCSDDDFLFTQRPWLIALGETAFNDILQSPKQIKKYWRKRKQQMTRHMIIHAETVRDVAEWAYQQKTGRQDFKTLIQKYPSPIKNHTVLDAETLNQLVAQG